MWHGACATCRRHQSVFGDDSVVGWIDKRHPGATAGLRRMINSSLTGQRKSAVKGAAYGLRCRMFSRWAHLARVDGMSWAYTRGGGCCGKPQFSCSSNTACAGSGCMMRGRHMRRRPATRTILRPARSAPTDPGSARASGWARSVSVNSHFSQCHAWGWRSCKRPSARWMNSRCFNCPSRTRRRRLRRSPISWRSQRRRMARSFCPRPVLRQST